MAPPKDTMFRSADMSLTQLYIANEIGREVVSGLGELGVMDFRDLNADTTAFQRTFTQEIRRLDNVERQLRYFRAQMEKSDIAMRSIYDFNNPFTAPSASEIDELADKSQSLEQRISSLNESYETLKKREVELTEWRWVLREAGGFFDRARGQTEQIRDSVDDDDAPLLQDVEQNGQGDPGAERSFTVMNIGFVAGVIPRERIAAFERILWRTLRGNLYMNQSEIPEAIINPENNEETNKNVFIIFAHGKEIIAKIRKISESLGADLYSVDENSELRRDQIREVNTRLSDLASVLKNTKSTLDAELTAIGRNLAAWMVVIKKEKATYETLNKFSYDHQRKTLIAEAWAPTNSLGLIKSTLSDVNERAGLSVPTIVNQIKTTKTPPTYFKTNRFTLGFQTIIDAYGTIKYREVNPALPAIVTFPFMFAVMFGDAGHGVILLLAALAMIHYEKRLERSKLDELFSMMFYGRYIVLMMGIFSIYTGLLYCDAFSIGLPWFKSMWVWDNDGKGPTSHRVEGYTYPFGLDYRWHDTENDLLFSNSYKMKLSILLGWCHMTFSLMWSLVNARYFKTKIDIWGNFVPGMIFFQSIFGYLAFTIVYKWCIDWPARGESPPSLLNMLIYMFLSPGTLEAGTQPLYPGQAFVQVILLLLALACVPILLFLKPFYLRYEHNKARGLGYRGIGETSRVSALDDDDDVNGHANGGGRDSYGDDEDIAMITQDIGHGEEEEEFEFSEVMIHQVIHTIEFCLNCVSHTASYLRLWALSLAHQRLSIVLWEMTMKNAFAFEGVLGAVIMVAVFYFWFALTVAVLCVMEGTSAMLHSLRLHWVEAMSIEDDTRVVTAERNGVPGQNLCGACLKFLDALPDFSKRFADLFEQHRGAHKSDFDSAREVENVKIVALDHSVELKPGDPCSLFLILSALKPKGRQQQDDDSGIINRENSLGLHRFLGENTGPHAVKWVASSPTTGLYADFFVLSVPLDASQPNKELLAPLFPKSDYEVTTTVALYNKRTVGTLFCAPKVVPPRFDSATATRWLQTCEPNRKCCLPSFDKGSEITLIDCQTWHIVRLDTSYPYVALSYVWGNVVQKPLIDGTRVPADTSAIILDAIEVEKLLGYMYLSADEYCVDQIDPEVKKSQIDQMNVVYGQAELKIVAACGDSAACGLPGVSE
ncbi:vacuolar ATP synthase-like protein 98 kDa subunit [Alternaria panax]|uniref:Vacuolar ATP synthase-like protein 98 kDa subunit n=1 Tax=Alternaria panax TaxID=48097 RepID=A0AAD4F7H7_9PLEO|nr:vacuolar ATP synthase-like protein 98 kDa subunit [Alternaria panax]